MSERLKAAIEELVEKIDQRAGELASLKRTVNMLCRENGDDPLYPAVDEEVAGQSVAIRPDQYYGKSIITAAREYLESRRRACQAEEILAALERGGFDFSTQDWKSGPRLRPLAITLGKNSAIFHRLPNGTYGLRAWYSNLTKRGPAKDPKVTGGTPSDDEVVVPLEDDIPPPAV